MILALALLTKALHLIATGIYEVFGLVGCMAAFAAIYGVSVVIDRSERTEQE